MRKKCAEHTAEVGIMYTYWTDVTNQFRADTLFLWLLENTYRDTIHKIEAYIKIHDHENIHT